MAVGRIAQRHSCKCSLKDRIFSRSLNGRDPDPGAVIVGTPSQILHLDMAACETCCHFRRQFHRLAPSD